MSKKDYIRLRNSFRLLSKVINENPALTDALEPAITELANILVEHTDSGRINVKTGSC